jgi:uncharacterized protein DUF4339
MATYTIIGTDGNQYGPVAEEQLRQWLLEGRINNQTQVLVEGSTEWKSLSKITEIATGFKGAPPPLSKSFLFTIGDIGVTPTQIITPNGSGALAGSQWIFADTSRTETKIPTVAIILAIVFALLCLIGLLFLLMKEKITTGYVEVSVRSGNVFHKTQIPVNSQMKIDDVRQLVGKAQALAMQVN